MNTTSDRANVFPTTVAFANCFDATTFGKTVYMTLGPYDFVQIIEAPNDEAVAKYVLSINSKGNVRTTTMRAWDEAEHFEFLKHLT